MPSNDLTPRKFADIVADTLKGDHILIESLNKWALEKRHMGGIVAVGKGSMNPPQLVSIAYQGDPNSREVLGIVGKGVTYDSGGLSLKSHKGLEFMKDDMAGAAAAVGVIGLMLLRYPVNVLAVLPLVENIPSGMAYHVDDILTMYNGKTVEVKNTDDRRTADFGRCLDLCPGKKGRRASSTGDLDRSLCDGTGNGPDGHGRQRPGMDEPLL